MKKKNSQIGVKAYFFIIFIIAIIAIPESFADDTVDEFSNKVDNYIDDFDSKLESWYDDAEIQGNETPLNTTSKEIEKVMDNAVSTTKSGKNFLVDFHHLFESIVKALSPIDIDPVLVLVISAGVTLWAVAKITKGSFKHMMIFALVFGIIIIMFMIGGINPEISHKIQN